MAQMGICVVKVMYLAPSCTYHEHTVVQDLFDNPKLIDLILIRITFWRRKNVVSSRPWRLTVLAQPIHNKITR